MNTQIIALGGGGFSDENNTLLDDYILSQASTRKPKVCFLPTASGDSENYVVKFYLRFLSRGAKVSYLSVFNSSGVKDLEGFLMSQDIIYVGGGNSLNLLALWREHGIDTILKEAYTNGTILAGASAGMVCWYREFLTDSYIGNMLKPYYKGLNIISESCCPHYDDPRRITEYRGCIKNGTLSSGIGVDGCVGVHYIDGQIKRVVSSVPKKTAYNVYKENNKVKEIPLEVELL
jgi:peptidase E